jgi:hypothetical protein
VEREKELEQASEQNTNRLKIVGARAREMVKSLLPPEI